MAGFTLPLCEEESNEVQIGQMQGLAYMQAKPPCKV